MDPLRVPEDEFLFSCCFCGGDYPPVPDMVCEVEYVAASVDGEEDAIQVGACIICLSCQKTELEAVEDD